MGTACMWFTDTHLGKTLIHKIRIKKATRVVETIGRQWGAQLFMSALNESGKSRV